jgi:hypothetical protein
MLHYAALDAHVLVQLYIVLMGRETSENFPMDTVTCSIVEEPIPEKTQEKSEKNLS